MTTPECHPLPAGFALGEYVIERQLSQGGFSFVYLAREAGGKPVVIKEYLPAAMARRPAGQVVPSVLPEWQGKFNTGMMGFLDEAKLLAGIRHANVVRVLNFLKANGTAYLVMRYEAGQSLAQHLTTLRSRGESVSEDFLRGMFVRLLAGLREVHKQKLLHLDIKPANIYLRADGNPVLLDFGAARWGLEGDAALSKVCTPGYAAPEQHGSGEPWGPWTDIYAVGATLYACLDGGRTPMPAPLRMAEDDLPPAQTLWEGHYSAQLLELIDWSLRLHVDTRPQSVYALQKVLNGELLDIVDPSWFER